jgi:hypothetical protein
MASKPPAGSRQPGSQAARQPGSQAAAALPARQPTHLAGHNQAAGQVREPHRAVRRVDVLPAGAAGAEHVDAHVALGDGNVYLVRLWQHHHGRGAGVKPPMALGGRHALHAVHAHLKLEAAVDAAAAELRAGVLAAARLGLRVLEQLQGMGGGPGRAGGRAGLGAGCASCRPRSPTHAAPAPHACAQTALGPPSASASARPRCLPPAATWRSAAAPFPCPLTSPAPGPHTWRRQPHRCA